MLRPTLHWKLSSMRFTCYQNLSFKDNKGLGRRQRWVFFSWLVEKKKQTRWLQKTYIPQQVLKTPMCNISSTTSSIFIVILCLFICNLYEKNHIDWGRFNSVKPILLRLSVLGDFIKFSFGFIFFLIPNPRGDCRPACRANCPKLSSFSAIYRAAFGFSAWELYAFLFFPFLLNTPLPFSN